MSTTEFSPANQVVLVRHEKSLRSPTFEAAVADSWREALEQNPRLFNGPVISPSQATLESGICTIKWHHSDFAHYLYSRQNRLTRHAFGTVFVSVVIPTMDGRLVAGKMSAHTSTPGVLQLPGGTVSIDWAQTEVTGHDLISAAVREVNEEVGIVLGMENLRISGVIMRRTPLDIGIVFATKPQAWGKVKAAFTSLRERELQIGVVSEFDELFAIGADTDIINISAGPGKVVDYLPAVIRALLGNGGGVV